MKKLLTIMLIFCAVCVLYIAPSVAVYALDVGTKFNAKSAYLIDYESGEVLYANKENEKLPVASIVKLMTILLTIESLQAEKLSLDDIVVASQHAAGMGGSQVFIEAGGNYSVSDMLKSVIVSSANDASVVLAETISGSEEEFVTLMNKRASELGLSNTNYANSTGLPASNQFSSAKDIAVLLKEVTKFEVYHNYSTIWMDELIHNAGRKTELVNTNKLIRYFNGCDGGKTGSTNEAGYCLAATAKRGDMRLIGVILGAKSGKDRFSETSDLLNYGFNNFENKCVLKADEHIENDINVINGKENKINVVCEKDLYLLTKKSSDDKTYQIKTEFNQKVCAPLYKGDIVGKMYVLKNNVVVLEANLISATDIEKASFIDNIIQIIENWEIAS